MTLIVSNAASTVLVKPFGLRGAPGPGNVLTIQAVNTLAPGAAATVTVSGTSPSQALTFGIPRGARIFSGSAAPASIGSLSAANGDLYARTNGLLYQVQSNAWVEIANLMGPSGQSVSLRFVSPNRVEWRLGAGSWALLFEVPALTELTAARDAAASSASSAAGSAGAAAAAAEIAQQHRDAINPAAFLLRAGDALTGPLEWSPEQSLASAATVNLGAATSNRVLITGTTTITSFGTATNRWRWLRFAGALTLTHNATSLILPGGANITTAAGDTALALSDGAGNWRVTNYQRASGLPLVQAGGTGWTQIATATISTPVAAVDFTSGLTAYSDILLQYSGVAHINASGRVINLSISQNGGSTWAGTTQISGAFTSTQTLSGGYSITNRNRQIAFGGGSGIPSSVIPNIAGFNSATIVLATPGFDAIRVLLNLSENMTAGTFTLFGR